MYFVTYTLQKDSFEQQDYLRADQAPSWMHNDPEKLIGTEQLHTVMVDSKEKTLVVPHAAHQGLVIAFLFGLMGLPCLAYALYPNNKTKQTDVYMFSLPIFILLGAFVFLA